MATKIRKNGQSASCFNSGCEFWLYDQSFLNELRKSGLFKSLNERGVENSEQLARPFIKRGVFCGVGMQGDGGVEVCVYVGSPLAKKELKAGRWLEPQTAFIDIPSGTLCIESNDCLRWGTDEPADKGAKVSVAPGSYHLTLYRADFSALERDEIEYNGDPFLITLTTGTKAKPIKGQPALLPHVAAQSKTNAYAVSGGIIQGKAMFDSYWDSLIIAIDRKGLEALGIREGDVLDVKWHGQPLETKIFFYENHDPNAFWEKTSKLRAPKGVKGEWGVGWFAAGELSQEQFYSLRKDATFCAEKKMLKSWKDVTVQKYQR